MIIDQRPAHLMSQRYSTVVILHIYGQFISPLVIPRLHLVHWRHDLLHNLGYLIQVHLVLLIRRGKYRDYGLLSGMTFKWWHHWVSSCTVTLCLGHLRLGLHWAKLKDPLRFRLVKVQMFLTVKKGLAHVYLVSFVITWRVMLESDISLMLRLCIVGREMIIRLETLIMRIWLLYIWSRLLKIKIDETFQSLIHMINSEQNLGRLILTDQIGVGVIERWTLSGLSIANQ